MRLNRHTKSVVAVLLVGLLAACGQGTVDSERDPIYFSPLEEQNLDPKVFADPGPAMPDKEREQIQPVIDGFRENARRVLGKPDVGDRISQIESIFIASGHIFELANIYQDIVEEEGISSPAAPRLAWILLQLGQEKQARMWIDRLLVTYPGRASSWYLDAIYHLPEIREGGAAPARVVYSWNRSQSSSTTELVGYGQRQIRMVGQQVEQLEQQLPETALDQAEDDLAELLATPVSKLETPPALAGREKESPEDTDDSDAPTPADQQPTNVAPDGDREPADSEQALIEEPRERPKEVSGEQLEKREPIKITLARAAIALSNGKTEESMRIYQQAIERDPDNVEARLGMARAGWTVDEMRNQSSTVVRKLAERDDLTPRQKYEIGLFAYAKMDDDALATTLWNQVAKEDPELAERVGLQDLLEKAGQ